MLLFLPFSLGHKYFSLPNSFPSQTISIFLGARDRLFVTWNLEAETIGEDGIIKKMNFQNQSPKKGKRRLTRQRRLSFSSFFGMELVLLEIERQRKRRKNKRFEGHKQISDGSFSPLSFSSLKFYISSSHQIPIKFKMKEKSRTAIFFHNLIGSEKKK